MKTINSQTTNTPNKKIGDLKGLHLQQLDVNEDSAINGGSVSKFIAIVSAAIYIYENAPNFAEGFREGADL